MGILDPKPVTVHGLDAATAGKINTPGSATATALTATIDTQVDDKIKLTHIHVLAGIGQSNMAGRGQPIGGDLDTMDPRVFQYGVNTGPVSGITGETVPLDANGTPSGLGPLTVIAHEYLRHLPKDHGILLIPAAKGSTGLANTAASQGCWKIDYTGPEQTMWADFLDQLDAALAAADIEWPTATITYDATFWHQGEGDNGQTRAAYESALDALIGDLRTHTGDVNHPFILGGMVPDYMVGQPSRELIRAAHIDTPRRLLRTAYADGIPNLSNFDDMIHYNREGATQLGLKMYEAMIRAQASWTSNPLTPVNVQASCVAGTLTVTWEPPKSRVLSYYAEFKVDGGAWVPLAQPEPLATSATATGLDGIIAEIRVRTNNAGGSSSPSMPITIGLGGTVSNPSVGAFSDDFNRADASTLGTAQSGQTWTQEGTGAVWSIVSNQAGLTALTGSSSMAWIDAGEPDGVLEATLASVGAAKATGLSFRCSDLINGYYLNRETSGILEWALWKRVAGTTTTVATSSTAITAADLVKVTMAGSAITVNVNGVDIMTHTDTDHTTKTKHGLMGLSAEFSARWDNISFIGA